MRLVFVLTVCAYFSTKFAESLILSATNKTPEIQQEYRPEGPLVLCKFL